MTMTAPVRSYTPRALIAGELRGARSGQTFPAVNPATLETIGEIPRCGPDDVDEAVRSAVAAFPAWSALLPTERVEYLLRLEAYLQAHAEELTMLDVIDNGSPLKVMRKDGVMARDALRYFCGLALQVHGETVETGRDRVNYTLRQPYGVVGRIIPFNHPLMFAVSRIAAPLLAGNTVVLKPSEHTSLSALRLAELCHDVFPVGVVNVVPGLGGEVGDALVTHPDVRRLAFIGAAANGRAIQARAASAGVKTVTLELGGKNAMVVFDDADLDAAAEGIVRGMNFTWMGQSCGSTSRLLVHRSVHREFVSRLVGLLESKASGMPEDEDTDFGAIVSQAQFDKVLRYIEIGKSEGATLVSGGVRPDDPALGRGLFLRPAVFDDVRPGSRLEQEEVFGPVLSVMAFDAEDEALRIANGVHYGLTASVWTRDLRRAHAFARDLEAGYVWVNDSSQHFLGTSFGGVKESGIGREEGIEELESYTQSKNVNVNFG